MAPTMPISKEMHATKYRQKDESFEESMSRVAKALADDSQHFISLVKILADQRFCPGGRIQAAMGAKKATTAYNCFVSGTVEDSFVNDEGNIMQRAAEAAATMRKGGGIGYDFSKLRPRGALIHKLDSQSSGPMSFMEIFDAVCKCVASSGHRRGAQMGVLRIDHPDIEEFIEAKQNSGRLTGFNLSVAVTNQFMVYLSQGKPFPLVFEGQVYRTIDPAVLWDKLMRATWDWAEPGVIFIDRINQMNNLWYYEEITATNPCGEQPLPPFGACLLGSFNITKYVGGGSFDKAAFEQDVPAVVRAMDNVVDRASYPLAEQRREAHSKRRMGLGVMGLANAGERLGLSYGSPEFVAWTESVLATLRDAVYLASTELAREKGSFPAFQPQKYLAGQFVTTLPQWLKNHISMDGIRNSHLTSIAPTGTISICADNVSSGIEPVFAHEYTRTVQTFDGPVQESVKDHNWHHYGLKGKTADQVTPDEHLAVLLASQRYVDSAISKTCNIGADVSWEDFKGLYEKAYLGGAKGCTTFRAAGKRMGVLNVAEETTSEQQSCRIDSATGRRECD